MVSRPAAPGSLCEFAHHNMWAGYQKFNRVQFSILDRTLKPVINWPIQPHPWESPFSRRDPGIELAVSLAWVIRCGLVSAYILFYAYVVSLFISLWCKSRDEAI